MEPKMMCSEEWDEFSRIQHSSASKFTGTPQIGGLHYASKAFEPIDYITANGLDFNEGNVIKYITRHREKNGAQDIRKAIQYCQFILKYQYGE